MSLNIANEDNLNRFISLMVSAQNLEPRFRHYNNQIHSIDTVLKEKRMLAEYMATRYLKNRLPVHWQDEKGVAFLEKITSEQLHKRAIPQWAVQAVQNNEEEVYIFDGSKMPLDQQREIRRVGLFLRAMAEAYIDRTIKFTSETKRPLKIYLDYLKGKHDFPTYVQALQKTIKWEQDEIKQQQQTAKVKHIMNLPNGYYAVELLNKSALQLEGKKMANCLCDDLQPYLNDITKPEPMLTIYSIRNAQGTPRVDLTVRREAKVISDCAAKANDYVHREDVPAVATFVNALGIPMRIMAMRHARLLQSRGRYYDVFHLPQDLTFHDSCLDLEGLDLKELPNLENVVLDGSFMCAHNQLKNLKGAPKIIKGCLSCYDNPIESLDCFPEQVGSIVTPIPVPLHAKAHIAGDVTIRPSEPVRFVKPNLGQIVERAL